MANDLGAKGWKSQGRPAVASAAVVHARTGTTGWMDWVDGWATRSLHCSSSSATCGHPLANKAYAVAPAHALAPLLNLLGSCVAAADVH
jgi:hypothetical protein